MSEKEQDGQVSMTTRLSREQHEALRKLSFDTRISIAEHLRQAVTEYLEQIELNQCKRKN